MEHQAESSHTGLAGMTTSVPSLNSLFASAPGFELDSVRMLPLGTTFSTTTTTWVPPSALPLYTSVARRSSGRIAARDSHVQEEGEGEEPKKEEEDGDEPEEPHNEAEPTGGSPGPRRSRRVAALAAAREANSSTRSTEAAAGDEPERKSRKRMATPVRVGASMKRARKNTKPPPRAKDDANYEDDDDPPEKQSCCICMSEPEPQDLSEVNGCDHRFCFDCIAKWSDRENTCPLCKVRFSKITRVNKAKKRKGEKSPANSKQVRERNQRSDLVSGAALEAMLNSIAASNRASSFGASSRLSRLLFMRGPSNPLSRFSDPANAPHFASQRTLFVGEPSASDEDDDNAEAFGLPVDFNELMRQTMSISRRNTRRAVPVPFAAGASAAPRQSSGWPAPPPPMFGIFSPQEPLQMPQQRSAASHIGDTAENPLEIDDDSDDDDEVEVIAPPSHG